MKKVLSIFIICTIFVFTLSFYSVAAFQDDSFSDAQFETIGSLGLGHLISDGQISELDFSNGSGDTGFLVALGKSIVTLDPTYVLEYGLNWATDQAIALLQSLENWFAAQFPYLYEFFSGEEFKYEYHPMPLETRKNFTHLLKDRVEGEEPIEPDPDVNFAPYLLLINGNTGFTSWYQVDFYLHNYNPNTSITDDSSLQLIPDKYSFISYEYNYSVHKFNNNNYTSSLISYQSNNTTFNGNSQLACEPITIYINSPENSNTYTVTTSVIEQKMAVYRGATYSDFAWQYNQSTNKWTIFTVHYAGMETRPTFVYSGSLENCFKIVSMNFRNVDIIVNGNLWSKGNFQEDDSLIYPIGIPDNFEILSGVQGGYYYPPDTYWNLDGLVQLIKQAITEYGVISISDIAPLIVDVNGVQAVQTTNVARTDYDNLISEQYSVYPDADVLQVPTVILDNGEVISFVAKSSGSDLIPSDVMLLLCGGGVLILIGYLINRMLE